MALQPYQKTAPKGKKWVKAWGKWFLVPEWACFIAADYTDFMVDITGLRICVYNTLPYPYINNAGVNWCNSKKLSNKMDLAIPCRYKHPTLRAKHSLRAIFHDGVCKPVEPAKSPFSWIS